MAKKTINGVVYSIHQKTASVSDFYSKFLPEDVEICAEVDGKPVVKIGVGAFFRAPLTSVIIPDSVITISEGAFEMSSLEKVTLSNKCKTIGSFAFRGTNIKSINIPDSINRIDFRAFVSCAFLEDVHLPDKAIHIGFHAFLNTKIAEDNVDEVFYIGNHLICVSPTCETLTIKDGTKSIADHALPKDGSIHTVSIPSSIKRINTSPFCSVRSLKTIHIKHGVKIIDDYAFNDCVSLQSIIIPPSVTRIGYCAFQSCVSLEEVVICNGVKELDSYVFSRCYQLRKITFPNSLKSIKHNICVNTYNLEEIHLHPLNLSFHNPPFYADTALNIYFSGHMTEFNKMFPKQVAINRDGFGIPATVHCFDGVLSR